MYFSTSLRLFQSLFLHSILRNNVKIMPKRRTTIEGTIFVVLCPNVRISKSLPCAYDILLLLWRNKSLMRRRLACQMTHFSNWKGSFTFIPCALISPTPLKQRDHNLRHNEFERLLLSRIRSCTLRILARTAHELKSAFDERNKEHSG